VPTVAAFDFDGTLSSRDNVVPFLRLVAGTGPVVAALAATVPALVANRDDPDRRDLAKAILVERTLGGRRAARVRDLGRRYARQVVNLHLRPHVRARLEEHRARGHELVLVSASLDVYLDPIAELLGIPHVLATVLEVGPDGRLTGRIVGANVRGAEKARRLDAFLAADPARHGATVFAYGDSAGDDALLARADHGVRLAARRRDQPLPGLH
jgi:phosphatidylglycerophosphatase C